MITRELCRTLSGDIEEALKAVADKHGLILTSKGGSFDSTSYNPKIAFTAKTADGRPADWDRLCPLFGLKPEDWGRTFKNYNGEEYRITGLDIKKRKYPVMATRLSDGKKFGLPERQVQAHLGRLTTTTGTTGHEYFMP